MTLKFQGFLKDINAKYKIYNTTDCVESGDSFECV